MVFAEYSNRFFLIILPTAFLLLVGCVLMYSFYIQGKVRTKKLKKTFISELEKERRAIASEIHDTLSAFIVPLKKMIHDSGSFNNEDTKKHWSKLIRQYQDDMTFANEKIYPVELQSGDLYNALDALSATFSSDTCDVEVNIIDQIDINSNDCIHIYRIIQESIVNAIKHSSPKFIQVVVSADDTNIKKLLIDIIYPCKELVCNDNKKDISNIFKKHGSRGQWILSERLYLAKGDRKITLEKGYITQEFSFKQNTDEDTNS